MTELPEQPGLVCIVDDDEAMRIALGSLLCASGLEVLTFGTARDFLDSVMPEGPACIVLDVRLPGLDGLELQDLITAAGIQAPILFMTGYGDIPLTVRAMKAGAVDFLPKPFDDEAMLQAVTAALAKDRRRREKDRGLVALAALAARLSPRERQVMSLVTTGLMNKQVAGQLGISEVTVKIHRHNAMQKMGARSLADLVRMEEALRQPRPGA